MQAVQDKIKSRASDAAGHLALLAWRRVQISRSSSHGYGPRSRVERDLRAEADKYAGLDDAVLEGAVAGVVKLVLDGLMSGPNAAIDELLTKLRVLTLIMCPDPAVHELVWTHCWLPLVQVFLKEKLVDELHQLVEGGLGQPLTWDGADVHPTTK